MDLNAFGLDGTEAPVRMTPAGGGETAEGLALKRSGRWRWLCAASQPPGRRLILDLALPGFRLEADGSLRPAGPGSTAGVLLLSEVRGSRFWPPRASFILRLSLLGRVWP